MASSTCIRLSFPKPTIRRGRIRFASTCTAGWAVLVPRRLTGFASDALPSGVEEISGVFLLAGPTPRGGSPARSTTSRASSIGSKRTYNVDENRVYLTGASDGGTGVYFVAFKDTTPWASFLPLIGDMMVLATPSVRADGDIFPGNAVNKPLYIVNAGRDRMYPAHVSRIYANHLQKVGAPVVFRVYPESEHSTAWWPDERATFEEFVHDHPREPLPDKISWQTDRTDRYNRAHWLVIDRLGSVDGESRLPDTNLLHRGRELDFGLRINSAVDRGAPGVGRGGRVERVSARLADRGSLRGSEPHRCAVGTGYCRTTGEVGDRQCRPRRHRAQRRAPHPGRRRLRRPRSRCRRPRFFPGRGRRGEPMWSAAEML